MNLLDAGLGFVLGILLALAVVGLIKRAFEPIDSSKERYIRDD